MVAVEMPGDDPQPSLWGNLEKFLGIVESQKMKIPGDHSATEIRRGIRTVASNPPLLVIARAFF